jgi:hypothetical protein
MLHLVPAMTTVLMDQRVVRNIIDDNTVLQQIEVSAQRVVHDHSWMTINKRSLLFP